MAEGGLSRLRGINDSDDEDELDDQQSEKDAETTTTLPDVEQNVPELMADVVDGVENDAEEEQNSETSPPVAQAETPNADESEQVEQIRDSFASDEATNDEEPVQTAVVGLSDADNVSELMANIIDNVENNAELEQTTTAKDIEDTEDAERQVTDDVETDQSNLPVEGDGHLEADTTTALPDVENVGELMANIFGDDDLDSDADEAKNAEDVAPAQIDSDDGEPKLLRIEPGDEEEEGLHGYRQWDFDVMMDQKKAERRKHRPRHRDGTISLISDADDQIKALVDAMTEAANEDRNSNNDRRPAIQKLKMLPQVKGTLLKANLFEQLIDNGMMNAISEWLAPLPDKSLPALEIRSMLLKILLEDFAQLEQSTLKQSGLGKAVMFLKKHPKETRENKTLASQLIREWSRPIFQIDTDFRSLSREERSQRDYSLMPSAKRMKIRVDSDGLPIPNSPPPRSAEDTRRERDGTADQAASSSNIPRARVPKPSTKDYVIRPPPRVEGQFRESKNRQNSRLDRTQREFRERNRQKQAKRAIGVSLSGQKLL